MDDDAACCQIISHAAEERGYMPVQAQSCEHATSLLRQRKFDCVSLDLDLGSHTGVDLFSVIAQCDTKMLVFIISGMDEERHSHATNLARRYDLNIYPALMKPLAMADLRLAFTFIRVLALIGGQAKGNVGSGQK